MSSSVTSIAITVVKVLFLFNIWFVLAVQTCASGTDDMSERMYSRTNNDEYENGYNQPASLDDVKSALNETILQLKEICDRLSLVYKETFLNNKDENVPVASMVASRLMPENDDLKSDDIKSDDVEELNYRIVGGEHVKRAEIPYQVAIYTKTTFLCGSSVITNYFVITAAHCMENVDVGSLWLKVGTPHLIENGETYKVHTRSVHPKYNKSNGDYDIALIKSRRSIRFGPNVSPIALPSPHDPPIPADATVSTSGWGLVSLKNDEPVFSLKKLSLKTVSRRRCAHRTMSTPNIVSKRQICALRPNAGTCFGDSGGPLVFNNKLIGIVSWGSPCAIGDPDVYTLVKEFLPWIINTMKTLMLF